MSENVKFLGSGSVVWGTDDTYTEGVLVDKASLKKTSDKVEIPDNDGNTKLVVFFNEKSETSITILAAADAEIPQIGDTIEICGVANCIVGDVSQDWTKGNAKQLTITATAYKYLTLA